MRTEAIATTQAVSETPRRVWITAFIFAFFILLCDGADIGF